MTIHRMEQAFSEHSVFIRCNSVQSQRESEGEISVFIPTPAPQHKFLIVSNRFLSTL